MIIMLQWMRLYTLGSRGSRELKTFLEICLVSLRIDQKLKNKGEIHRFLKRFWPKNRGQLTRLWDLNGGVMGAVSIRLRRGFNPAMNPRRFGSD